MIGFTTKYGLLLVMKKERHSLHSIIPAFTLNNSFILMFLLLETLWWLQITVLFFVFSKPCLLSPFLPCHSSTLTAIFV